MKRLPSWIRVRIPDSNKIINSVYTICKEANCPNQAECHSKNRAAFLIMGNNCTRSCRYCNVSHNKPNPLDPDEPKRLAKIIKDLKLKYAVITSVTRDDLPDYGAEHFFQSITEIKKICRVEALVPDFNGNLGCVKKVLSADPYVFNHNIEVVKELFPKVRPQGDYQTSLKVLKVAKRHTTKSGFMVGLGENYTQIRKTLIDLKNAGVNIVTIGQYLQPRKDLEEVHKFYTPKEFKKIETMARKIGFKKIFCGPLIRSSYIQ
jgi:lipoic acid synthetase